MIQYSHLTVLLAIATMACNDRSKASPPVAEVVEVASVAAQIPASAEVYKFSNADSTVAFTGAKVTGRHSGSFGDFSGEFRLPDQDVSSGQVEVSINVSSLRSDDPKLTQHLASADFLDVARFPSAKFVSTQISPSKSAAGSFDVTGNLTLHGVTKSIRFPAQIAVTQGTVSAKAAFELDRQQFGIRYPGMPDDLIDDQVAMNLEVEAKRPEHTSNIR